MIKTKLSFFQMQIKGVINQTLLKKIWQLARYCQSGEIFNRRCAVYNWACAGGGWWAQFESVRKFTCYTNVVESPRTFFVLLAGYLTPKLHRSLTDI